MVVRKIILVCIFTISLCFLIKNDVRAIIPQIENLEENFKYNACNVGLCQMGTLVDGVYPITSTGVCENGWRPVCHYEPGGAYNPTAQICSCLRLEQTNSSDEVVPPITINNACYCENNRVIINECEIGLIATCANRTDQPACACYTPEVAAVEGREDTSFLCDTVAGNDTGIETALGCIPMDMNKFAPWLLQFIFGIAGGIAFLLMVYGFILMATSSGDEKKLQGAKETVTSAITGLLVSIFALFIFRLIAVNILHIPGLN